MRDLAGISVVVLAYDRPKALTALLDSLAGQDLDIRLEVIVCNNDARSTIKASPFTRIGRRLRALENVKVFNSSHNWLCRVRYPLATLAQHDTVAFIDDDTVLDDAGFLAYMAETHARLRPIDVIAGWTALWTGWDETHLRKVRMNFDGPDPDTLVECDYAGPGLSMFHKSLLTQEGLLDIAPEHHRSDSTWFPWLTAMRLGTRKYYFPCHGRVSFHAQYERHALTTSPGFRPEMYGLYKSVWKQGYVPVLERLRAQPNFKETPEWQAAHRLREECDAW